MKRFFGSCPGRESAGQLQNHLLASMRLQVAAWKVLTVEVSYAPNSSADYSAYTESLGGYLEGVSSRVPYFYWESAWAMTK